MTKKQMYELMKKAMEECQTTPNNRWANHALIHLNKAFNNTPDNISGADFLESYEHCICGSICQKKGE